MVPLTKNLHNSDILYVNAQSFIANKDEIIIKMFNMLPKIIILSEARCTPDIEDAEICVQGYNCIRCNSSTRHTGGVIMFVRSNISFTSEGICGR